MQLKFSHTFRISVCDILLTPLKRNIYIVHQELRLLAECLRCRLCSYPAIYLIESKTACPKKPQLSSLNLHMYLQTEPPVFSQHRGLIVQYKEGTKLLFFYRAGDHAVDQVLCQEQIQDHDGHGDEDGAGGEAREFCFSQAHQTHCNGPGVLCFQQELG